MARVNVESLALAGDGRYGHLAELLGLDKFGTLGRMVYVWNACQERETYFLTPGELFGLTGIPDFGEKLIASGLGKRHGKYRIYISGSKTRVEWLGNAREKARENGKKGGRPRKAKTQKTEEIAETETKPRPVSKKTSVGSTLVSSGFQFKTPLPLPLSLALVEEEREKEFPNARARDDETGAETPAMNPPMSEVKFLYHASRVRDLLQQPGMVEQRTAKPALFAEEFERIVEMSPEAWAVTRSFFLMHVDELAATWTLEFPPTTFKAYSNFLAPAVVRFNARAGVQDLLVDDPEAYAAEFEDAIGLPFAYWSAVDRWWRAQSVAMAEAAV